MAYLNGNSANKNQQKIEENQSVELNKEAVEQLERFLNLLADLDLIDFQSERGKYEKSREFWQDLSVVPEVQIDSPKLKSNLPEESDNSVNQVIKEKPSQNHCDVDIIDAEGISTDNLQEISRGERLLLPQKMSELKLEETSGYHQQYDAEVEALEALQNLLFGSQVARLIRKLNTKIKQKRLNYQQQIYHQDELANVLGPLLPEVLFNNLGQTDEEVIETIAPVIDKVIQKKFRQDRQGISSALAPLLPPAIEAQIQLEPQAMAEAIAPIIDIIITKKTEQDQPSITKALAPLLPPAITYTIQNYPQEIAKALGPEMGSAIREQIKIDRREISQALAPEMGRAIKEQIALEKNAIVDALYPVIGSTISKYMAEAIREINDKLSDAFSFRGIRRKIQATFQGVSEAELIISEVMICTVQAVFLIHKESGLVIAEAQQSGREELESEMVAGMLTAIRSFVNDCIMQSGNVSELNEIEYGDSKIILEVAGYCYLAVVLRGEPNKSFIKELRQTLSNIIIDYGKYIKNFDGDSDRIPSSVPLLLKTLIDVDVEKQEHQQVQISKPPTALLILCGLILSLMLIPWGIYEYYNRLYRSVEVKTTAAWNSTPELAIYSLGAKVERGSLTLSGRLPNQNLKNQAVAIAQQEASLYNLELNNQIVAVDVPPDAQKVSGEVDRMTKALNQMEGVSIATKHTEGKVTVAGTVMEMEDTEKIIRKIEQIPGVKSVISTIKLSPLKLKTRIYFEPGSTKLQPAYEETIVQIREFLSQYPQKHIKIIGHTDRTGNQAINQQLAIERANKVRDALVEQGVDARRLQVTGQTNSPLDVEYNQPLLLSRCVTFELFEPSAKDN